jgi:hypothetical protein
MPVKKWIFDAVKDQAQLSYRSAVQLVIQATKQVIVLTGILLNNARQALFKAIASIPVGLQKRKNQPRAIKRRPKPYPRLTIPRHEACATLGLTLINF